MDELILFPAIDLKDGACVRLYQGDMAQSKTFNKDPAAQAKSFQDAGFKWLHLVDLDGAFEGKAINTKAIEKIRASISLPIQLGGGIRTLKAIDVWLDLGIDRIILGTAALKNPDLVIEACQKYPHHIAVGIDAREGMVATEGWAEQSDMPAVTLCQKFQDAGVCAIIYTDIHRDGALKGINISETAALAEQISIPVIASGGLTSYEDIIALKAVQHKGIMGAISGKALYENKIDPSKALDLCKAI